MDDTDRFAFQDTLVAFQNTPAVEETIIGGQNCWQRDQLGDHSSRGAKMRVCTWMEESKQGLNTWRLGGQI